MLVLSFCEAKTTRRAAGASAMSGKRHFPGAAASSVRDHPSSFTVEPPPLWTSIQSELSLSSSTSVRSSSAMNSERVTTARDAFGSSVMRHASPAKALARPVSSVMPWPSRQVKVTGPGAGCVKRNTKWSGATVSIAVAGTPLTKRSAASIPSTGSLKTTSAVSMTSTVARATGKRDTTTGGSRSRSAMSVAAKAKSSLPASDALDASTASTLVPSTRTVQGCATGKSSAVGGSSSGLLARVAWPGSPSGMLWRATSRPLIQATKPSSASARSVSLPISATEPATNVRRRYTPG